MPVESAPMALGSMTSISMAMRMLGLPLVLVAVWGGDAAAQINKQPRNSASDEIEVRNGVFSPSPRELRQMLTRAQKLIEQQKFAEAVEMLQTMPTEDYFIGKSPETGVQQSVKSRMWQMLSQLPSKGREFYELSLGAEARQMLEEAIAARDLDQIAHVSSTYFHTKAGMDATFLLGRLQLQIGQPSAASLTLQRLADATLSAGTYDPELSLLLAIALQRSGKTDKGVDVLVSLKSRLPNAKFISAGTQTTIFSKPEEARDWLVKWVGEFAPVSASMTSQWTMVRGNESRTAATEAGNPLSHYRWSQPLVYDRQDESRVKDVTKALREKGGPLLSALQPLVVADQVFMRTPDRLVGVDLRTGRALWVYPWDETVYERLSKSNMQNASSPLSQVRKRELEQRLLQDNTFGQLSSDGERLFLIDEIALADPGMGALNQINLGRNQTVAAGFAQTVNKLVALSIKKQGALQWVVGGETGGDEPALAGTFFLGAPLPSGDKLYAMVEVSGEIRLVCLDASNGKLLWKQAAVSLVDRYAIDRDRRRRIAGTSPSLSDGILICPTSGEAVVAIDLTTRRLLWGHQYAKGRPVSVDPFESGPRSAESENAPWLDSNVVIADGVALVTPVDAPVLLGLDLLTGKPRWPAIDRGSSLFLGCVHEKTFLVVGKKLIQGYNLNDGKPAWREPISLEDEQPSGRGYYNGQFYFLPTTGQQLLKIDVKEGKVVERIRTQVALGNLVAYQEDLISQGIDQVAAFYMSEPLQRRVEQRLAKDPLDAWALARQGELLFQAGKPVEALEVLRKAVAQPEGSDSARLQLTRVMLSLLSTDYKTHKGLQSELEKLVDSPDQMVDLHKIEAQGLEAEGSHAASFVAYLELADELIFSGDVSPFAAANAPAIPLWEVARDHNVSPVRWLRVRLAGVAAAANDADRQAIAAEVAKRAKVVAESANLETSRKFLELVGFHPAAEVARQARWQQLVQSGRPLELELNLGEVAKGNNPEAAAVAYQKLAQLYTDVGRSDLAIEAYRALLTKYAEVRLPEGKTGAEFAQQALAAPELQEGVQNIAGGKILVTAKDVETSNNGGFSASPVPLHLVDSRGMVPEGLRLGHVLQLGSLRVRPAGNQNAVTIPLRSSSRGEQIYSSINPILPARLSGHSLLLATGQHLVLIDLLRKSRGTGDAILWQLDPSESDLNARRGTAFASPPPNKNPLIGSIGGRMQMPAFHVGPVTSRGIGVMRGKQLLCVDSVTGKTLWERSGIETGSELFGDEEVLIVVASNSDECMILSMLDGTMLDRRKIDKADNRWAICGRNVLAWERVASALRVRLYNASNQEQGLWTEQFPIGTKGAIINGDEVALLTPEGNFVIVSLHTGAVLVKTKVDAERRLDGIVVQKAQGRYQLMIQSLEGEATPNTVIYPLSVFAGIAGAKINGPVYCLDAKTGAMCWQVPAQITQQGWLVDQPADQPVMLFARSSTNMKNANRLGECTVLAIDRRDGSMIAELSNFLPSPNGYEVNYDRSKSEVSLTIAGAQARQRTVKFRFTEEPAPPQPAAQTGAASSLAAGRPRGSSDGVFGAIMGAISRSQKGESPEEDEEVEKEVDPFGGPFK